MDLNSKMREMSDHLRALQNVYNDYVSHDMASCIGRTWQNISSLGNPDLCDLYLANLEVNLKMLRELCINNPDIKHPGQRSKQQQKQPQDKPKYGV